MQHKLKTKKGALGGKLRRCRLQGLPGLHGRRQTREGVIQSLCAFRLAFLVRSRNERRRRKKFFRGLENSCKAMQSEGSVQR